ncbi:MAG: transposase [Lentisphaerales bacterium]|nr:transposase [Lentisphaerales bacterium]
MKERLNVSDRETVEQSRENPYLQYFIGFDEFCDDLSFDSSSMVHSRKRFTLEALKAINEKMCLDQSTNEEAIPPDDDSDDPPNQGTLIVDATCTPADITYPTDVKLLNDCREKTEEIIDKLHDLHQGKRSLAHTGIKPGRIF